MEGLISGQDSGTWLQLRHDLAFRAIIRSSLTCMLGKYCKSISKPVLLADRGQVAVGDFEKVGQHADASLNLSGILLNEDYVFNQQISATNASAR